MRTRTFPEDGVCVFGVVLWKDGVTEKDMITLSMENTVTHNSWKDGAVVQTKGCEPQSKL